MKTFLLYALLVIGVVLLTDVISNLILGTTYKTITNYEVTTTSPQIEVKEAKTSKANGFIKGIVTNHSEQELQNKYIKTELMSREGTILGTEFYFIDSLPAKESQEFEIHYRYNEVDHFTISTVDEPIKPEVQYNFVIANAEKLYMVGRWVLFIAKPTALFIPFFLFNRSHM